MHWQIESGYFFGFKLRVKNHGLTPCLVPKNFQDFPSNQILWHMHGALNVDKKDN
jgi:hypothetical protein